MGIWDAVTALGRANVACADYLHHHHKNGLITATTLTAIAILLTLISKSPFPFMQLVKQN